MTDNAIDDVVLDVKTYKKEDSKPVLTMPIADIKSAADQPEDDTDYEEVESADFDTATRIEMHLDYWDADTASFVRIVDGAQASWDATAEEFSYDFAKGDTSRVGDYRFEIVLVFDDGAPASEDATDIRSVPMRGYFGLQVEGVTDRTAGAADPVDRSVSILDVDQRLDGHVVASEPGAPPAGEAREFWIEESGLLKKKVKLPDGTTATIYSEN